MCLVLVYCLKGNYWSFRSLNVYIHFLAVLQENAGDDLASLKKELAAIRQLREAGSVDSSLSLLRQHLARTSGIFGLRSSLAIGRRRQGQIRRKSVQI